jgi:hypothetical protein
MANLNIPYTFTNGTTANATEVNAVVSAIKTFVDTQLVQKDGSIKAVAIAIEDGAVTTDKILNLTIVDGDISNTAAIAQSKISGLVSDLSAKAPTASPTFTGTPTLPTGTIATTQTAGNSTTAVATTAFVTTANNLKANVASPTFTGTVSGITKSMVGLGSVDNTTDAAKPVSTAQQTALDLKANLASPTFTGTVNGITKSMVGLGNVDNTTDAAKPVSTATQSALDLKSNVASPTFTGVPAAPTAVAGTSTTQVATTAFVTTADALKANLASPTFTGTPTLPTGTIATTQVAGNNTTAVATTAFVTTADNLKANLASPALTGTPTAPTAAAGTNTTQIATMASKPWNTAWGIITPIKENTSPDTSIAGEEIVLTSNSFTPLANRYYRITYNESQIGTDLIAGLFVVSQIKFTNTSGNRLQSCIAQNTNVAAGVNFSMLNTWVGTLPAVSTVIVGTISSSTGTSQAFRSATNPAQLIIEDIGPV